MSDRSELRSRLAGDVPHDLDPTDHVDEHERQAELAELAEVLKLAEPFLTQPVRHGSRATLTMPLLRLVDVDGTSTVIVEAVVDVELVPAGVLAILDGDPHDVIGPPVTTYITRRLTPQGRHAVADLTELADGDA